MLFLGVLVAAVVLPYVMLDQHLADTVRGSWDGLLSRGEEEDDQLFDKLHSGTPAYRPLSGAAPGSPLPSIEQAFRFDVSPQWVLRYWPGVSTIAAESDELGMRVAWVSGTRPDDVAGSLTYYFDAHHRLQRITFTGLTSDPRRLLMSVVTPYSLKSQPTTDAAYYIAGDPQEPTSEVIVGHPILTPGENLPRAEVTVDLRRSPIARSRGRHTPDDDRKTIPSTYRLW
jgi:hypothetical protein